LDAVPTRWLVLYAYPRTGGPDVVLPGDWDLIPGARGCTPQACAFRDHEAELGALDATVWGLSAQPITEQRRFARRMHIPFPLLNDSELTLSRPPLSLPTFTAAGLTLYRRATLIATGGRIVKVFYPVFPPDRNARDVIAYLTSARST
jgi:peroxiredoxin